MSTCGSCYGDAGVSSMSCKKCGIAVCKKCARKQRLVWLLPAIVFPPLIVLCFTAGVYCGKTGSISGGICKEGNNNPGAVEKVANHLAMQFLGWLIAVIIVAIIFNQ